VVALGTFGFNPVLTVGEATETVTVTAAPPVLNTTDATVGLVMENATYSALPLQMNNAQRDPTAFAALAPGAQAGRGYRSLAVRATILVSSISTACRRRRSTSRATIGWCRRP